MIPLKFLLKVCLVVGVITIQAPIVSAQSCAATDCQGCLEEFNCVWMKDGTCIEGCGSFPNVDCYFPRIFGNNQDLAAICDAATNDVAGQESCFANTDATSCLASTGCDWVSGNVETGRTGNWCVLDLVREIADPICTATTCSECLADDTCVWMKGDTCKNSCDNFPNIECYYATQFGATFSSDTTQKVCEVASALVEENELCSAKTNQTSCLATQVNTTCAWVSTADAEEDDDGHCSYNLASADNAEQGGGSAAADGAGASYLVSCLGAFSVLILGVVF